MPVIVGLALYYSAIFIGSGASLPFMPVWFRAEGLSGTQIAIIVAAPQFARTLTGPLIALWADSFRLRRTPLIWMGVIGTLAYASLGVFHGFWPWLIAWFVGSGMTGSLSPFADVITLRRAARDGFTYAAPRGVGSAAYICGNVGMGLVLLVAPSVSVLIWTTVATSLTALAARIVLPPDEVHDGGEPLDLRGLVGGLRALLADRVFMLAIVANGLIQASHGFYYSFSALSWRRQGVPDGWIGALWGFAVGVEVLFMWLLEPWRRRTGPVAMMTIGGVAAMLRWSALSLSPPLILLFPIQALHALSYAATFLASLRLVEQLSPREAASSAQTLNSSFANGVLTGLATAVSGPLFDTVGVRGYWVMTVMAAVGVGGALWLPRAAGERLRSAT